MTTTLEQITKVSRIAPTTPECTRDEFKAVRAAMIRRYCVTRLDRRDFELQLGALETHILTAAKPHMQLSVLHDLIPMMRAGDSLDAMVRALGLTAMGRPLTDEEVTALLGPTPTPAAPAFVPAPIEASSR